MASDNKASSSEVLRTTNEYIIEGLTLYDMHRGPRAPVVDDSSASIEIRTLNKDLTCPICLNIMHNTLTVMECLHRFCSGNLRPDPNFDALIKVLYPDLEKYEQQEETRVQQINQEYVAKAVAASVEEGMKRQKQAKRLREKTERDYVPPKKEKKNKKAKKSKDTLQQNANAPRFNQLILPPEEISIAVAPHPNEKILPRLSRPFLRIPAAALVKHVMRFVGTKFTHMDCTKLRLALGVGVANPVAYAKGETGAQNVSDLEKIVPLSEDVPLPSLCEMWRSPDEILVLYYLDVK